MSSSPAGQTKIVLLVTQGPHRGSTFTFREHDTFVVGRGKQAHFRLPTLGDPDKDRHISRVHFMIELNPPLCRLIDLQSTNGTYVNDQPVHVVDLKDGDVIHIGRDTRIRVAIEAPPVDARVDETTPAEDRDDIELILPEYVERLEFVSSSVRELLPGDYLDKIRAQPQTFPGYVLVDRLGSGGMGVVYLAVSEVQRSLVALKVIEHARSSAADVQRFLREADILRTLDHPRIVRFREMGETEGQLFLVMDYVPGIDAGKLLRRVGPLAVGRAVRLVCQALEGLDHAHRRGFVHRDVKPTNLLVAHENGREAAKLADFGLARVYQNSRMSGMTIVGDVTGRGEVGGTVPFMPPEQITHFRESRPGVDIYATAATLYYLLTAQYVYDFPAAVSQQLLMILDQEPVPIRHRRADLPPLLEIVIHRGLARDPADRFGTAQEMREALLPFADRA